MTACLLEIFVCFGCLIVISEANSCPYTRQVSNDCYKPKSYQTKCGFWGLARCTRYSSERYTCYHTGYFYKCCPGYTGSSCNEPLCYGSTSCLYGNRCMHPDRCSCRAGFALPRCNDINECSSSNGGCEQVRTNHIGYYNCSCNVGFRLNTDANTCSEIDECAEGTAGCSQLCHNTVGSFLCSCRPGYAQISHGKLCQDIDECLKSPCPNDTRCVNSEGSYTCVCMDGYNTTNNSTNIHQCQDIDECEDDNGDCSDICVNTPGSFHCDCPSGYELKEHLYSCLDIDECGLHLDPCTQGCLNVPGNYTCTCGSGYVLAEDGTTCTACINKVADVIFVVDSSASIGNPHFDQIKEFIKQLSRTLTVSPNYTRVGLIGYSSDAHIEFNLTEASSLQELLLLIDGITYYSGETVTSDAIQLMRLEGFDGERVEAPDIAIVITDGQSKYPHLTKAQAQYAKDEDIAIIVVGIGQNTDLTELQDIATDNSYVLTVDNYDQLNALDGPISHHICNVYLRDGHFTRFTTTTVSTPTFCRDILSNCTSYPRDSCNDFKSFSQANCAWTCGFCPDSPIPAVDAQICEDKKNNCVEYGSDMCFDKHMYDWVDQHCRQFCGFCGNKTDDIFTTTLPPTTTITDRPCVDSIANCDSFEDDICTNLNFRHWAKTYCPRHCHFCFTYKTYAATENNGVKCPAWKLPVECSLISANASCDCPTPSCPDDFRLVIKRHDDEWL